MRRSGTAPCSSCAPPPRLPLRTVPTDPSAERSVPAALLAQPSFDVGMAIVRLLLLALCFGVAVSAEDEPVDDCIVDNEDVLNDAIFGMIYKAESEEEKEALGRYGLHNKPAALGHHTFSSPLPPPTCTPPRSATIQRAVSTEQEANFRVQAAGAIPQRGFDGPVHQARHHQR